MNASMTNLIKNKDYIFCHPDVISGTLTIDFQKSTMQPTDSLIVNMYLQGHKQDTVFFHLNFFSAPVDVDRDINLNWNVQVPDKIHKDFSFKEYSTTLNAFQRYTDYMSSSDSLTSSRSSSIWSSAPSSCPSQTTFQAYECLENRDNFQTCEVHTELPPSVGKLVSYSIVSELLSYSTGKCLMQIENTINIQNEYSIISPKIEHNIFDPWMYYNTAEEYNGQVAYQFEGFGPPGTVLKVPVPDIVDRRRFQIVLNSSSTTEPPPKVSRVNLRCHLYHPWKCKGYNNVMAGPVVSVTNLKIVDWGPPPRPGEDHQITVELPPNIKPTFHHCLCSRTYSLSIEVGTSWFSIANELEVPVSIGQVNV